VDMINCLGSVVIADIVVTVDIRDTVDSVATQATVESVVKMVNLVVPHLIIPIAPTQTTLTQVLVI
jgi:hypothetical protein